jgi:hypothetical protein
MSAQLARVMANATRMLEQAMDRVVVDGVPLRRILEDDPDQLTEMMRQKDSKSWKKVATATLASLRALRTLELALIADTGPYMPKSLAKPLASEPVPQPEEPNMMVVYKEPVKPVFKRVEIKKKEKEEMKPAASSWEKNLPGVADIWQHPFTKLLRKVYGTLYLTLTIFLPRLLLCTMMIGGLCAIGAALANPQAIVNWGIKKIARMPARALTSLWEGAVASATTATAELTNSFGITTAGADVGPPPPQGSGLVGWAAALLCWSFHRALHQP